jgi:hypothetical protein
MKKGDTILVKTYALHEGWVGSKEAIYVADIDDQTVLVQIPELAKTTRGIGGLWKLKKADIIGVKTEASK